MHILSFLQKKQRVIFAFLQIICCVTAIVACKPRNSRLSSANAHDGCTIGIEDEKKMACIGFYSSYSKNVGIYFNKHNFFDPALNFVLDSAKRFDDMSFSVKVNALMFLIDQFWLTDNQTLPHIVITKAEDGDAAKDEKMTLAELLDEFYLKNPPAGVCAWKPGPSVPRPFSICYSATSCDIATTELTRIAWNAYALEGAPSTKPGGESPGRKYQNILAALKEDISCLPPTTLRSFLSYRAESLIAQAEYFVAVKDWSTPFRRAKIAPNGNADTRLRNAVAKISALMTRAEASFLRKEDPTLLRPRVAEYVKAEFLLRPQLQKGAIGEPDNDGEELTAEQKSNLAVETQRVEGDWFAFSYSESQKRLRLDLAGQFANRLLESHRINTLMYLYEKRLRINDPSPWFNDVLQQTLAWTTWLKGYRARKIERPAGTHAISPKLAYLALSSEAIGMRETRLAFRHEFVLFLKDLSRRVGDSTREDQEFAQLALARTEGLNAAAFNVDQQYSSNEFFKDNQNIQNLIDREKDLVARFPNEFESLRKLVIDYTNDLIASKMATDDLLEHMKNAENTPVADRKGFNERLASLEKTQEAKEEKARFGSLELACLEYVAGRSGSATHYSGEKKEELDCWDWMLTLDFPLFDWMHRNTKDTKWLRGFVNDTSPFKPYIDQTSGLNGGKVSLPYACLPPSKTPSNVTMNDIRLRLNAVQGEGEVTRICTAHTKQLRENAKYTIGTNLIFMTPVMVVGGNIVGNMIRQAMAAGIVSLEMIVPEGLAITTSNLVQYALKTRLITYGAAFFGKNYYGQGLAKAGQIVLKTPFDSFITSVGLQVVNRSISSLSSLSVTPFVDPVKSWDEILVNDWGRTVLQDTVVFSLLHLVTFSTSTGMRQVAQRFTSPGWQSGMAFGIDFSAKSAFFSGDFIIRDFIDDMFKYKDPHKVNEDFMTRFSHSLLITSNFELFDKIAKGHFSYEMPLAQAKFDVAKAKEEREKLEFWRLGRTPSKVVPKFAVEREYVGEGPAFLISEVKTKVVHNDEDAMMWMDAFWLVGMPDAIELYKKGQFDAAWDKSYAEFQKNWETYRSKQRPGSDEDVIATQLLKVGSMYNKGFKTPDGFGTYVALMQKLNAMTDSNFDTAM